MEDSVLDEIHQGSGVKIFYDGWKNEKIGAITDSKGNCIYRFIEAKRNNNGELVALHEKDEENPIVMVGIVSYWIKHRKSKNRLTTLFIANPQSPKSIRELFDNYTDLRYNQFKEQHADDPATWKYDWDYEFFCKYIVPHEMSLNKETEALYEFISDTDIKHVRSVMDNYIEYLKTRRTELGYHVSPQLLVLRSIDSLNEFALEDLEDFEISTIVDTLEREGYVKAAWVEGHRLESIRLLDKGKVYMKHLEDQEKNKQEPIQTKNAENKESNFKTFIDSIVAHDEDIDEIFSADNTKAAAKIPTFEYDEKTETLFVYGNPKTKDSEADIQKRSLGNITQEDLKKYPALEKLCQLVHDGESPKYQLMPYRAAIEAGALLPSMPNASVFNRWFGTSISPANYTTWVNADDNPYENGKDARPFRALLKTFEAFANQR